MNSTRLALNMLRLRRLDGRSGFRKGAYRAGSLISKNHSLYGYKDL